MKRRASAARLKKQRMYPAKRKNSNNLMYWNKIEMKEEQNGEKWLKKSVAQPKHQGTAQYIM